MECETCCEEKTDIISCPGCSHLNCLDCAKRWILSSTFLYLECISCKTQWTNSFLFDNFEKKWIREEYSNHKEKLLWSLVQAYLPLYQSEASIHIQYAQIEDKELANEFMSQFESAKKGGAKFSKIFTCKCPKSECRGIVYSPGICELCQLRVCPFCHEVKEDEKHRCNPDIVENVDLIREDSKPCPVCFSPIFKIDGCSQMFCTMENCHTLFDWNTGKIEKVGHNPHFYEWMRKTRQIIPEIGDRERIECGRNGNVNLPHLLRTINESPARPVWNSRVHDVEHNIIQVVNKLQEITPIHGPELYKDDIIDYLIGKTNEKVLRDNILKTREMWELNNEVLLILTAYREMMYDLFWYIQKSFRDHPQRQLIHFYENIIDISDRELKKLQSRNNGIIYRFYRNSLFELFYPSNNGSSKVVWRKCWELRSGRLYERTASCKWIFHSPFTEKISYEELQFETKRTEDLSISQKNGSTFYVKFVK